MYLKLAGLLFIIFIAFFAIINLLFFKHKTGTSENTSQSLFSLKINNINLEVELADTLEKRATGLSNRDSLQDGHGMLFVYQEPGFYSFWMKEMQFPIDIIWINPVRSKTPEASAAQEVGRTSNGVDDAWKIVDIAKNVQPDSFPQTFQPQEPAQYVLEVNAGFSGENNIEIGDFVDFAEIFISK